MAQSKEEKLAYQKKWYKKNRVKRRAQLKEYMVRSRQKVRDLKESTPCKDCGVKYPYYVMQFDHVPELGTKKANMANLVHGNLSKKLREEIKKCELVCANCHAIRTHKRKGLC